MEGKIESVIQAGHCSESITKLAKAMLKVQKAIGPAVKDKKNDFTKSTYATLNSVVEACISALTDAGIWMSQYPVAIENSQLNENVQVLALVTKLVHADSGEWQSSLLVMPLPKNDPQGYGSAMTYARRYGLSAMVGIVTEDDDANSACQRASKGVVHNVFDTSVQPEHMPITEAINQAIQSSTEVNKQTDVSLPKIDGVTYQRLTAGNGAPYITATGNTRGKTPILKEAGFQWDASGKKWWKYAS